MYQDLSHSDWFLHLPNEITDTHFSQGLHTLTIYHSQFFFFLVCGPDTNLFQPEIRIQAKRSMVNQYSPTKHLSWERSGKIFAIWSSQRSEDSFSSALHSFRTNCWKIQVNTQFHLSPSHGCLPQIALKKEIFTFIAKSFSSVTGFITSRSSS